MGYSLFITPTGFAIAARQVCTDTETTDINKTLNAAHLLVKTNLESEVVGFDCGFDSLSHFYKRFRQHYEISPAGFKYPVP